MWCCECLKSPGPDEFCLLFVNKCWCFLKEDVISCFKDFHSGAIFSKLITSYFLILILKSSNPLGLDDYRPICLVVCIYKVLYKELASRIKRVLVSIISQSQSAFVPGRQLLDGVLVTNEVVNFPTKEVRECLPFKVDFERAYDKVSWSFLRFMMKKMGFGEVRKKWMEALIFSSKMSVLVNGSPTKEFGVERGYVSTFIRVSL